jgi:hypothetical protein
LPLSQHSCASSYSSLQPHRWSGARGSGAVHDMHAPSLADGQTHHAAREKSCSTGLDQSGRAQSKESCPQCVGKSSRCSASLRSATPAALGQCGVRLRTSDCESLRCIAKPLLGMQLLMSLPPHMRLRECAMPVKTASGQHVRYCVGCGRTQLRSWIDAVFICIDCVKQGRRLPENGPVPRAANQFTAALVSFREERSRVATFLPHPGWEKSGSSGDLRSRWGRPVGCRPHALHGRQAREVQLSRCCMI